MEEQPMPSTSKAVHIRDLETAMRNAVIIMTTNEDKQGSATEQCSNTGANNEAQDVEMESIKENKQIQEQPMSHRPKTAARKDLEAFLQHMLTRKNELCTAFCNADDNNNPQESTTLKAPVYQIVSDEKSFSPPAKRKFKY